MSSEYLIGRGWAKPPEQKAQAPLYCYRTLGKVDCYRSPQVGKGRLIERVAAPIPASEKATLSEQESPMMSTVSQNASIQLSPSIPPGDQ